MTTPLFHPGDRVHVEPQLARDYVGDAEVLCYLEDVQLYRVRMVSGKRAGVESSWKPSCLTALAPTTVNGVLDVNK